MARERMVTRTVELTVAEVMTLNTDTAEVRIIPYEIGGGLTDPEAILKAVKKIYESATVKCVAVKNVSVKEILYGMTEQEFIAHAKVLPPRGANAND